MPMTPDAAKQYKPRRTPGSLDEVIYPEYLKTLKLSKIDWYLDGTKQIKENGEFIINKIKKSISKSLKKQIDHVI